MRKRWSVFVILLALLAVGCVPVATPAPTPTSTPPAPPQVEPASGVLAYVFNMGSRDVSVIDTSSNEVVRTVPIEGVKKFGWIDSSNYFDGENLWIGNLDPETGDAEVLLLNLETLEVTRRISVGTEKANIFVSRPSREGKVFVSLLQSGEVVVIDTASFEVVERIPANKIACDVDIGVAPDRTEKVFVPNRDADSLQVIDPQTLEVTQTMEAAQGTWPWMLTVSPDGRHVWVQDAKGNTNTVWNAETLEVVKRILTGNNPSMSAFTPDGKAVYAGHLEDTTVVVIDAQAFDKIAEIEVGANPVFIGFRPDGRYAYVTVRKEITVAVIDTASHEVVKSIPVGETPLGIYVATST